MIKNCQGEREIRIKTPVAEIPALIVHHLFVAARLYENLDGSAEVLRALGQALDETDPAHPALLEFVRALDHSYARYDRALAPPHHTER